MSRSRPALGITARTSEASASTSRQACTSTPYPSRATTRMPANAHRLMHTYGIVVRRPATGRDMPRSARIGSISGPTPTTATRSVAAVATMPMTASR
jgi:hypothetical protein